MTTKGNHEMRGLAQHDDRLALSLGRWRLLGKQNFDNVKVQHNLYMVLIG